MQALRRSLYLLTFVVAVMAFSHAQTPLRLVPVAPCRVVDTRPPHGGGAFQGTMTFNLPQLVQNGGPYGNCNFSLANAQAYSLNVTVIPSHILNYLTIWPAGEPQPLVSLMNSYDGRVKANAAIVPAGASGAVSVYVTDLTNVLIDINAYFDSAGDNTALAFFPLPPCRLVDTRSGNGGLLQAGQERDYLIPGLGSCGIPSDASAYSFNVTVIPAPGGLDYLTVWPEGEPKPVVSTLNDSTGTVVANAAIVPAGPDNETAFYPNSNNTDLLVDTNGYFAPASSGSGPLSLFTLTPCRVIDTRGGIGEFTGTIPVGVVGSSCGIPGSSSQAFVFNATVIPDSHTKLGYLTLWPEGTSMPMVSTLNAYDGAVTSNMAIVPAGPGNNSIDAFAGVEGTNYTNLILDISSYFAPVATLDFITRSLPDAVLNINYSYTLLVSGGVPPYTWSLNSGALPPHMMLNSNGTISGAPTSTGTFSFQAGVSDSEVPTQTGVIQLSLTVDQSPMTLAITTPSLPNGSVNNPYNAVLTANGGVTPYTWSIVSGSLPVGLTLAGSTGQISGTPGAAGYSLVTVMVTDAQNHTAMANLSVVVDAGNANGALNGMYAFSFSAYHADTQTPFVVAGSLATDGNGNVTGGEYDFNDQNGPQHATVTGGSYTISSNGQGQINFTDNTGGNIQLLLAVGNGEDVRVISMNTSGNGAFWGAGVLRQQNPSVFNPPALAGNWAFGFQGFDSSIEPISGDGVYHEDANGNFSNGNEDINDFGTHIQTTFTGNVTSSPLIDANGRATVQYHVSGVGTLNLAEYVISAGQTVGIEIDPVSSGGALFVTDSQRQSQQSFNNSNLNGNGVGRGSRQHSAGGGHPDSQAVVLFVQSANGNITITSYQNTGGTVSNGTQTGTYSVSSNGRAPLNFSDNSQVVCYLIGNNQGYCINAIPQSGSNVKGAEVVYLEPQTGGPYGLASVSGEYAAGSLPQYVSSTPSSVSTVFFDGAGNGAFVGSESGPSGIQQQSGTGTYSVDSTGFFTLLSGGSPQAYGYVVNPGKIDLISADSNPRTLITVRSAAP